VRFPRTENTAVDFPAGSVEYYLMQDDQKFVLQTCMVMMLYHIILYTIFVTRNPDLPVHVYASMYNRDVCHNIYANVWTTLDLIPPPRNGISRYATLERSQTRDDVYIIRVIYIIIIYNIPLLLLY